MAKSAPGLTRSSILSKTIVFIDSRVEDHPTLIRGLSADCEPVWLDATQDGLQQMQAALADRRDLASIRILAHGRPGALWIGAGELTCENVDHHAAELAAIGRALGIDGDVQIYGCEVGKGSDGRAFVRALAEACGAHVAASSKPVGHADLGGEWRLDVGQFCTPPIHNLRWHGLLGITITPVAHSYDRSAGEWRNGSAFAALRADGSLVTWGYAGNGGNISAVAASLDGTIDVTQVFSSENAFAALRADGSVVTWGNSTYGGNSSGVATKLDGTIDVTQVFSTIFAFAALRADGSVVTWGYAGDGGDSSAVAAALDGTVDVTQVFSTGYAFAVLRADGSVVTWGRATAGGDNSAVAAALDGSTDVTQVFSTLNAYAALRVDGSVVTWGGSGDGGNSSAVAAALDGTIDVTRVFSTIVSFAALRADGSLVTWGDPLRGGNSSAVATKLDGTIDVTQVFSTAYAFAALRADGSVVTWGDAGYGGNSSAAATKLEGTIDVTQVFSSQRAFAALRADGSLVTWGDASYGGDSSIVAAKLDGTIDVTQVFSTGSAFAALRADGSVVTWGLAGGGGDSSAVAAKLDGSIDVTQVFSTGSAFAALRADGSVVTWGYAANGGNSSAVASQLQDVVSMANPFTNDVYTSTTSDTTAPTVLSFNPADGATGVAPGSHIVLTFSESIARGTGSIVLKTAAGATIESFDAATSSRLTLSGSTLTIDPTSTLANGTNYYLTFAAGTVKDLAGNAYAGITTYDFTTASSTSPLSKLDDFMVLQYASPSVVGAGGGNDTYLLSNAMLPAGTKLTITDPQGSNSIQLASGLAIASSKLNSNTLQLTLSNGSEINVLGADRFTYEAGGNATADINLPDVDYATFVQTTLGVALPTSSTIASGGAVTIGSGLTGVSPTASSKLDDFVVLQYASPSVVGAGGGSDTYLLSNAMLPAGTKLTITDPQGSNSIQLASGLAIASSKLNSNTLQLTLSNGSEINVLGADRFTYEAGGNATADINLPDVDYATFVQTTLGVALPTGSTIASGGAVTIGSRFTNVPLVVGSTAPVTASAASEAFTFNVAGAKASAPNTQIQINGFSTANDQLTIDTVTAAGNIKLAALDGIDGITVLSNPITGDTLINFGADANGDVITITLAGMTDPSLVNVSVV